MTKYTDDNTEGYAREQLDELNAEWERLGGDELDEDEQDRLNTKILKNFDPPGA